MREHAVGRDRRIGRRRQRHRQQIGPQIVDFLREVFDELIVLAESCYVYPSPAIVMVRSGSMPARTHGHCVTRPFSPTYCSWAMMRQRCTNPRAKHYARYGGRGIRICGRWKRFELFLADMSIRPPGTTLDRIRKNGHYTPRNCRWATRREQQENRIGVRLIRHSGMMMSINAWARHLGIPGRTMHHRLTRWSIHRALTTPHTPHRLRHAVPSHARP
jgi:hypothetical protein